MDKGLFVSGGAGYMLTPSLEDYLEEIYRSSLDGTPVRPKELAEKLTVSMPSVTKALQRLNEDGHVYYKAYGSVLLTPVGESIGKYLCERNDLLKRFVNLLGVDCDVAGEVESMEHYISPDIVKGISRLVTWLSMDGNQQAFSRYLRGDLGPESLALSAYGNDMRQLRRFGGKSTGGG